ncbi:hypothetical protein ACFU6S_30295 [Streptomyces sp. NPDC057456]|uniref:hypothetical protein n=1 Tax=Streptomyces sp. NPDC057456 TaxID=3346139 RepID=UPI003676558B
MNIALRMPEASIIWPVQRVLQRFQNGPESSIVSYATGLGPAPISRHPSSSVRRRSWLRGDRLAHTQEEAAHTYPDNA